MERKCPVHGLELTAWRRAGKVECADSACSYVEPHLCEMLGLQCECSTLSEAEVHGAPRLLPACDKCYIVMETKSEHCKAGDAQCTGKCFQYDKWFRDVFAAKAKEQQNIIDAVSDMLLAMRCSKGCCLAPSTRVGLLHTDDRSVADELTFCDECGGLTVEEFAYAKELRVLVEMLEEADRFCWDEGSVDPPGTARRVVKHVPTRELLAVAMWAERTGGPGNLRLWNLLADDVKAPFRRRACQLLVTVREASVG